MDDGWTPWWRRWFEGPVEPEEIEEARLLWVRDRVREAVRGLAATERVIIEAVYYDGMSLDRAGAQSKQSKNRVLVVHRRALAELRVALTPLVSQVYGLGVVCESNCPICLADWRYEAEAMLDAKTAEMTWGEMIKRMERAFGWQAKSPRVLIVHQQCHRVFQSRTLRDGDIEC